jgi:pimeloyl-ACP methyl ester carboxylesterase
MGQPELVKFEIEAAEMAVRLAGDREKPALLLIHGFPSSSESFQRMIGPLVRDCFVITPDLRNSEALSRLSGPHSRVSRT